MAEQMELDIVNKEDVENTTDVAVKEETKQMVAVAQDTMLNAFGNTDNFKSAYLIAQNLAKSDIIPSAYQNKPMNVMIAVDTANHMGVSPMFVMEEMAIIKGKRSWSGKACLQLIKNCPRYKNVKMNWVGKQGEDSWGAYVSAIDVESGEEVKGTTVTIAMAKAEGWTSNSKWKNLPELMLQYRAGAFFARINCPDMLSGYVEGELEDIGSRPLKKPNIDL